MSVPQDLFGMEGPLESGGGGGLGSRAAAPAEPAELVQELASRYDAAHHTLDADEELPGSFAARAVIGGGGASAVGGDAASKPPPSAGDHRGPSTPAAAGAAGPAPPGSPLDPGVGPEARASEVKSQVPGEPVGPMLMALDVGRDLLQSFAPLGAVHEHVCGFHFYAHDLSRQVEAHHYCSHPSGEVRQCCLFDSDQKGARLIGVEYIISARLFAELPEEEKRFWHSHRYEVGSGQLVAPRVPDIAERQDMQALIGTYGKTWHMWQVDRGDPLPYGPPQLMMAPTEDGQIRPELLAARDARYGVSTAEKGAQRREKLEWPEGTDAAADHWRSGTAWQVGMESVPVQGLPAGDAGGGGAAGLPGLKALVGGGPGGGTADARSRWEAGSMSPGRGSSGGGSGSEAL